jgi:uncharacterized membrane protein
MPAFYQLPTAFARSKTEMRRDQDIIKVCASIGAVIVLILNFAIGIFGGGWIGGFIAGAIGAAIGGLIGMAINWLSRK